MILHRSSPGCLGRSLCDSKKQKSVTLILIQQCESNCIVPALSSASLNKGDGDQECFCVPD